MAFEKNPDEIGALWKRTSKKDGKVFLGGKINGESVIIFPITEKKNPNQPDFRVLKSRPQGAQPQASQQQADPFGQSGMSENPFD